ncbi:alpha/beta fold hydrolase [Taibaiella koreensis]|uniref:alpha/beta fold hydrolase n=1 Tax=Taibaiella koreensis TaxID=1268548 RepID=UPI000E59E64F|nr:alpha/beta hydrolase [Taibaiella koreensis]
MKTIVTLFLLLFTVPSAMAKQLYSKAYGNPKDKPVIFLHGGPGGNATLFEASTAAQLAGSGFYVIVYDRRGEGRSADPAATFTYQEAFKDLNSIYHQYGLRQAALIGHSFGGLVATLYTQQYPDKVSKLVLAGALFSQQETYDEIQRVVKSKARHNSDTATLLRLTEVAAMDHQSAAYRKGCYDLAGKAGLFDMPQPTEASRTLRQAYEAGPFFKQNIRNSNAPIMFFKNEILRNIDTKPLLKEIKQKGVPLYAVYGKQDGIFSIRQLSDMKEIVGPDAFCLIDNCSHYLFVDQQKNFLRYIKRWLQ